MLVLRFTGDFSPLLLFCMRVRFPPPSPQVEERVPDVQMESPTKAPIQSSQIFSKFYLSKIQLLA